MAMLIAGSLCSLCKEPLRKGDSIFTSWGVWLPQDDPLWRFCDSGMHWSCYETWPQRPRFARSYFDFWINMAESPYWSRLYLQEGFFIKVDRSFSEALVYLAETGSRLPAKVAEWPSWLARVENGDADEITPLERRALLPHITEVRARLPNRRAFEDSVPRRVEERALEAVDRRLEAEERLRRDMENWHRG